MAATNPIEKLYCVFCPDHGFNSAKLRPFCSTCKSTAVELTEPEPTNPMHLHRDIAADCYAKCDGETLARFVLRCAFPKCHHSGTIFVKNLQQFMQAGDSCLSCSEHHEEERTVYFPCRHSLGLSCFAAFVESALTDKRLRKNPQDGVFSLCCPMGCPGAFLQDVLVVKALGRDIWLRFRDAQCELMIQDQKWVYCPHCNEANSPPDDVRRDNTGEDVFCVNCETVFCVNCLQPGSHAGPCQVAARETRDTTGHYVLSRCCRNPDCYIVGSHAWGDGCHHITCKCGDHFCYVCGGEFNEEGYSCENGCPLFCEDVEGECVCPRSTTD